MSHRRFACWLLWSAILLMAVGCSDSDTTGPGGGTGNLDTTAPLIANMNPSDQDIGVPVDRVIDIFFSEPMDQASVEAALTLDEGTVSGVAWNAEGSVATISHTAWTEGTKVAVTVGAAAKDLAGNAMPQAFGITFYTYSSVPVMLGYDFFGPLTAVQPDGFFVVNFSEPMDLSSLLSAYTLTEVVVKGAASVPGVIVGTVDGDLRRVTFRWDGQLTPSHAYRFGISTSALTQGGINLSEAFSIDFTAGTELDETPPYIVSTEPALGAVVDPNLQKIVISFNERVDPSYVTPTTTGALLEMYVAGEPTWNDDGDELTVYMRNPLPKGIRFYAIWDAGQLSDIAGNFNTAADSVSFTTSGTASLMPVRSDARLYYYYSEDTKLIPTMVRQTIENIDGNNFDRVMTRLTLTGYDDEMEHWFMGLSGADVMLRGFREGGSDVMLSPAVRYLPGSLPQTWSGSTTASSGEGTMTLNYTGTLVETFRQRFEFDNKSLGGSFLDNCVQLDLYHEMIPAGAESKSEDGTDHIYLCPGLGVIALQSEGREYDAGEVVDTWAERYSLQDMAFDDQLEFDR